LFHNDGEVSCVTVGLALWYLFMCYHVESLQKFWSNLGTS